MLKYLMKKNVLYYKSTGISKLNIYGCVSILYIMGLRLIIDLTIIRSDIHHFSVHQKFIK